MVKKSNWVTIVDGCEIDTGCINCHYRVFTDPPFQAVRQYPVCPRCGREMENAIGFITIYKLNVSDAWKMVLDPDYDGHLEEEYKQRYPRKAVKLYER